MRFTDLIMAFPALILAICTAALHGPDLKVVIYAIALVNAGPVARDVALLGKDMPANDTRQDYVRARLVTDAEGRKVATPFSPQDSSMLSLIARADCLIVRKPHAPAAAAGTPVDILPLSGACWSV